MTIQPNGYIVTDNEAIWGTGATADDAWGNMVSEMVAAWIEVVDHASDDMDGKTLASNFRIKPATAALIEDVQDNGGDILWQEIGGVCCTLVEHDNHCRETV